MITPAGHYALYRRADDWIFVAGQTGEDEHGDLKTGVTDQTHHAIANIETILHDADAGLEHIVSLTC